MRALLKTFIDENKGTIVKVSNGNYKTSKIYLGCFGYIGTLPYLC